jgi:hypothetical protein
MIVEVDPHLRELRDGEQHEDWYLIVTGAQVLVQ